MEKTLIDESPKSETGSPNQPGVRGASRVFEPVVSAFIRISSFGFRALPGVLFWMLTLAGLGLLFLVLGLPLVRRHQTMETMSQQMETRNEALRSDVERLLGERDALLYDAFYVEKVARRDLNMSRRGEDEVRVLPASFTSHRTSAEQHINTSHPVGLWRLYGTLRVLAEDTLIRQVAVILGGLAVIAAVLLFGRSAQKQTAAQA